MGKRSGIQNRAAAVFLAAACFCGSFTQPCGIYAQERAAADGILECDAGTGPQAGTEDTVSGSAIRNDGMETETEGENGTGTEDENAGEASGGEYTDSSGVVFKYRTDSGEADIYQISGCPGKDVSIPGEVDGFLVKRLTAEMRNISVRSLTIPETVVYMEENAFRSAQIGTLYYNAADVADIEGAGPYGPFGYAQIGDLQIGAGVKAIPGKMFAGAVFQQESILLDVREIRDAAFYSAEFKEVTIGENVAAISGGTFRYAKMEKLNYNAASAQTDKTDGYVQAAFFNAEIGELEIGGGVEKLPYGFMAGAKVSQDSLTIPDSVASIESYAFFAGMSPGNMSFGTLTIGKNAERLGDYIFGNCRIGRCVINLLKAPSGMTSYADSQPECGSLVSHNLGVYFNYFKAKTDKENVTVLCKDFKTDRWPEYYNGEKGCFAQLVEVSCTECGHTEHSYEYSDAVTVVFAGHDGTELSRQHLHPGEDAAAPEEAPEREGWKFTGWDKDFTNVSENLTVTAQYEPVCYTVTFKCGDEVISSQEVPHGGAAKAPDAPKLEGHKFTGWDADFSNITGDLTVTAQYKAESYAVMFFDGTKELSRQYVDYGCAAKAPEDPVHEGMQFTGWDRDFSRITEETAVFAKFAKTSHTVIFMDGEKEICRCSAAHGGDAEPPENPARPDEAWGRWVFTGWDGTYQNVTKDETVYACFEKSLNQYKVIFYDAYGKAISTQTVEYGGKAEAPKAPEKEADAQHTYIFKGWDADTGNITADTAFHPVYESRDIGGTSGDSGSAKTYTVTFMDGNTVIDVQKVEAGKDASVPKNPSRPGGAWGKWIFTGWKGSYKNVAADETVYACFEKKLNEYRAVFYDAYGNIISTQTVEYGGKAEMPEAPEKAADTQHTYIFKKWDADTGNITADIAFHPVYESRDIGGTSGDSGSAKTYTVTFMDGNTVIDVQKVEAGKDASVPKNPSRPGGAWGKWIFTGWKGSYKNVAADETVYACFEKKLNEYRAVFYDAYGNIISTQTVEHGGKAETPEAPEKAADAQHTYIFKKWDADTGNITADTAFHPVYESRDKDGSGNGGNGSDGSSGPGSGSENARTYTVTFMDWDAVLDVQKVETGKDASIPKKPSRPDEEWGKWRFTGWKGNYKNVTKDETVYACFEKKLNKYKVVFYDAAGNAVSAQTVKHGGSAKVPKAPGKAPDAKRTYVFKCWDADTENITADTSFHPVYKAKARTYTVTFMGGKKTLAVQNVKYGSAAKAPKKPVKKADGKYVYKFAGWDADFGFITKDTVIHALFDAKENGGADKTADQKKDTDNDTAKGNSTDKNNGGGTEKRNQKDDGSSKHTDKGNHKGTVSSKNDDKDNNIQKNSGNNTDGTASPAAGGTDGTVERPESGRKTGSSGYTADSGQKTGIGTGKGYSHTGNGNPEKAGKQPLAAPGPSVQRPAAGASAQKQERQAGSRESRHTQGKAAAGSSRPEKETADDNKIVQEKTEEKMDEDSSGRTADDASGSVKGRRNPGGFSILLLLSAAVSAVACAYFYLRASRKYRVTGAVCDADGNPVCGAHILLSGEKTLETCTDGQGKFCFDGVGKGIRRLEVWLDGDSAQLSMDIRVGERDAGKAFRIRSSHCIRVGHALEKDGYAVNVSL